MSDFNKIMATPYEHYCVNYHKNNYKNQDVYHWSNIPEDILKDSGFITDFNKLRMQRMLDKKNNKINTVQEYGLDGIACEKINDDLIFHGLQMKLWEKKLTGNDLGTFYQVLFCRLQIQNKLSKGYIYHSCKLEINLSDDIKNSCGIVVSTFIENPFKNDNKKITRVTKEKDCILRNYQKEAIEKLNKNWEDVKLLSTPCGTGKTIICAHHLNDEQYDNVFLIAPLKCQVKQLFDRVKNFLPKYESLLVDSDSSGTTDFDDVKNILNGKIKCITASTFKSTEDVLYKIFEKEEKPKKVNKKTGKVIENKNNNEEFDLSNSILIVDEAHNLLGNEQLVEIVKKFPKVLLVTATPPLNMEEIMECDVIYDYKFKEAIENKHICDCKFYLPMIIEKEVKIEKPKELTKLDDNICKKCLFVINGMLKTGSRRCIVYLTKTDEYEEYKKTVTKIMNDYHGLPFWTNLIVSETTQKQREEILKDFKKNEDRLDTIKLLFSIRILDEGIDIVKCDSVFITKIGDNVNDIRMVQRVCRANRIDTENPNKVASCFLWCDDLNKAVNSLELLKSNDPEFSKKVFVINSNYDVEHKKETKEITNKNTKDLIQFIDVKCITYDEIWENKRQLLFKFCNENNRCIKNVEKINGVSIGYWLHDQKRKIPCKKNGIYKKLSENAYVKENLDSFLLTHSENIGKERLNFDDGLNILFTWCNQNGRVPSNKSKNDIEKKIGMWLSDAKKRINVVDDIYYKKLSQNAIIKKSIDTCLQNRKINGTKEKLTEDEKIKLCFEYCDKIKSHPVRSTVINGFSVGKWLSQKLIGVTSEESANYKKLMSNKYIKSRMDDFLKSKNKKITNTPTKVTKAVKS